MIFFSVGLPGRFAEWCDAVIARLAGCTGGSVVTRTWPPLSELLGYGGIGSTLEEIGRVLIANSSRHIVIGARQPEERLRQALAECNARFLVVLDDPRNAVADIFADTGADPKTVVRAVANSCPLVMQCDGLPGALTLRADCVSGDRFAAIAAIAAHYGITAGPQEIEAIADELAGLGIWPPSGGDEVAARLPSGIGKMVDGALLGYREYFFEGRLSQIIWTRELFVIGDGGIPNQPLDVAGGTRVLIFGPYIYLPPGSWTAQVVLGFSPEAVGSSFRVDAYAEGELALTTFEPKGPGIFNADLTFSVAPGGRGVEVRVMVASNGAQGQLAFGRVVLRPLGMRHAEQEASANEDFTSVLAL